MMDEFIAASIRRSALDPVQIECRMGLARFTASVFEEVGRKLNSNSEHLDQDGEGSSSPHGKRDNPTAAISLLLRIGSQLVSAGADLIDDGRQYAGAALIRQLVEVEYLAWAFDTKDDEAARWLHSTSEERRSFFTPAKLRKAAGQHFRSVDYSFHCELGGHPVPGAWVLLKEESPTGQLMLSDCLGHSGRVWDHIVGWAKSHGDGDEILRRAREMFMQYSNWKKIDQLTSLPPPPAP